MPSVLNPSSKSAAVKEGKRIGSKISFSPRKLYLISSKTNEFKGSLIREIRNNTSAIKKFSIISII